jgi:hypothetical protein
MGHLSARDSMKGTIREDSFSGDPPKDMLNKEEMGICFHMGPAYGERGGALLS